MSLRILLKQSGPPPSLPIPDPPPSPSLPSPPSSPFISPPPSHPLITPPSPLFTPLPRYPWDGLKGYPTIYGIARHHNLTFANFGGDDGCMLGSYALANHHKATDTFHPHQVGV